MNDMSHQQVSSSEEMSFQMVRSDRIAPFPDQPRKFFDPVSIEELAVSIQTEGQRTPVQLCKSAGKSGSQNPETPFTLIDGERRWRACSIIAKQTGKPFLMKATIEVVSDVRKHFEKSFGANFGREDMTSLEIAEGLKRLREDGLTLEELSKRYGKSMAYIVNYLSLNNLDVRVKQMMHPSLPRDEKLGVTHAIQIARVKDAHLQVQLAKEALENDLSVSDVRMSVEGSGFQHLGVYRVMSSSGVNSSSQHPDIESFIHQNMKRLLYRDAFRVKLEKVDIRLTTVVQQIKSKC